MKQPHTLPTSVINLFFIIGLISALSFRTLMAVGELYPDMIRLVWYVGIIGYILFFSFRYFIARKRRRAITEFDLISKIKEDRPLSENERGVVVYLLSSLQKSRENLNYLFIFTTSILAILVDIALIH